MGNIKTFIPYILNILIKYISGETSSSVLEMKRLLQEKDKRILSLETEATYQRYKIASLQYEVSLVGAQNKNLEYKLFLQKNSSVSFDQDKYTKLLSKWNDLVTKINDHGGDAIFDRKPASTQFDKEDINRLLMLCHPDKHGGKEMATKMTAKLIKLRN